MSRCAWIRSLCLWMLPAIVLCVGATSFGTIAFSNNALASSSTAVDGCHATVATHGYRGGRL